MSLKWMLTAVAMAGLMQAGLVYAEHEDGCCCKKHEAGCCKEKGKMFKEADTSGDGKLSHDEFKAQHDKRGEEMFKRMDANGDGVVDEAEKKAMHDKMHDKHKDHCERKDDKK